MSLTKSQQTNLYGWCLHEGVSLEYGKLSLCDLQNFRHSMLKDTRRYQVHCDDHNYPWSMIYEEMGPAINKFLELKAKIKRVK